MASKYWLAKNPNGEVTDAQVQALKSLSTADLDALDDLSIPMAAEADLAVDAAASVIVTKVNALLAKLRTAGLLVAS
jgi:hypothetical protein|tara:strand:- start:1008 stop:1238 length:231 start_codon:yes stop_codon:yes gene_type:complete